MVCVDVLRNLGIYAITLRYAVLGSNDCVLILGTLRIHNSITHAISRYKHLSEQVSAILDSLSMPFRGHPLSCLYPPPPGSHAEWHEPVLHQEQELCKVLQADLPRGGGPGPVPGEPRGGGPGPVPGEPRGGDPGPVPGEPRGGGPGPVPGEPRGSRGIWGTSSIRASSSPAKKLYLLVLLPLSLSPSLPPSLPPCLPSPPRVLVPRCSVPRCWQESYCRPTTSLKSSSSTFSCWVTPSPLTFGELCT